MGKDLINWSLHCLPFTAKGEALLAGGGVFYTIPKHDTNPHNHGPFSNFKTNCFVILSG